jgi:branched-chain amino acid transport system substrate-binding protein
MKTRHSMPPILLLVAALSVSALFIISCGSSEKEKGETTGDTTGVTDTSVKLGSLLPLTGVAAQWGVPMGQGMKAYFDYINDQGGIWGRDVNLIIGDSQYTGPGGTEAAKQLIDQQKVFAFVGNLGTEVEAAVKEMIDADNIPDMFVLSGSSQFINPVQANRFTAMVDYTKEGKIFATYIAANFAGKKLGILAQNDDYGKEGEAGTIQGLEDLGSDITTTTEYYDASITDVTSQLQRLKGANVDVIMFWGGPLQAANTMKTSHETLNWDVPIFINEANAGSLMGTLAGIDNVVGTISTGITMNTDVMSDLLAPRREIFQKYAPSSATWDSMAFAGMSTAEAVIALLKQNGPDLSRESFIATSETVCNWSTDISLVPESTSPTDHEFIEAEVFVKAEVSKEDPTLVDWSPFGDPVGFESTTNCKVPKAPKGAADQPGQDMGQ